MVKQEIYKIKDFFSSSFLAEETIYLTWVAQLSKTNGPRALILNRFPENITQCLPEAAAELVEAAACKSLLFWGNSLKILHMSAFSPVVRAWKASDFTALTTASFFE